MCLNCGMKIRLDDSWKNQPIESEQSAAINIAEQLMLDFGYSI